MADPVNSLPQPALIRLLQQVAEDLIAAEDEFRALDAALGDGPLPAVFLDLPAVGLSVFRKLVPVFAAVFARISRGAADLEDFLRDFLDIRLPFVAFGGSIIGNIAGLAQALGIAPLAGQI